MAECVYIGPKFTAIGIFYRIKIAVKKVWRWEFDTFSREFVAVTDRMEGSSKLKTVNKTENLETQFYGMDLQSCRNTWTSHKFALLRPLIACPPPPTPPVSMLLDLLNIEYERGIRKS